MRREGHRKQVLLFLMAVLLPVVVLVGLTIRIVGQEAELAEKRAADERRRVAREVGRSLAARLDRLVRLEVSRLREAPSRFSSRDYLHPEVVLIARIDGDRLQLPWEAGPSSAVIPAEASLARVQRARALMTENKREESLSEYRAVLSLAPEVVDEYGVPLSFYAASPMLDAGADPSQVIERIGRQLRSGRWLSPEGLYRTKDLVERILSSPPGHPETDVRGEGKALLEQVLARVRTMERALGLKEDLPRLGFKPLPGQDPGPDESLWISYGRSAWLVGRPPLLDEGGSVLVAMDLASLLSVHVPDAALSAGYPGTVAWAAGDSSEGTALGPAFPDLRVVFGPEAGNGAMKRGPFRRSFYLFALAVVLSVTLFGAYLLWRDVRREILLAELRSQFVSGVSHELKTPLTAIRMFAETLRLGRTRDPAARSEYLDTIVHESERLTRLLNDVLDFSRIEQGTRTYHMAPASLAGIVRDASRAMEYPLKQAGFALDVHLEEDMPPIRVDRDAIEQAVLNLLSNAMKYSGGSRRIVLSAGREGDLAVIRVVDRGVGIPAKDQARIFERFYRVPSRENRSLPGTGLGLSLVAHTAKAHGGSVFVESAPGAGSTFSIHLPLEGAT
jgi:signal transduction histidine kinase